MAYPVSWDPDRLSGQRRRAAFFLLLGLGALVLFALEKRQFALKLRVAREASGFERSFRHRGFHGAARFSPVPAVLEPAGSREARDVAKGPLEHPVLVTVPELDLAESRRVDQKRAARQAEQFPVGGRMAAASVAFPDRCHPQRLGPQQVVDDRGFAVHAMSAWLGQGLEALASYLAPGKTCVLLGSSGAGKTQMIVNHLLGAEALRVAPVREGDGRGRHTTTHRELLRLPGGALLIDTPGLREVQLWNGDEDGVLERAFGDIASLATACRFKDCRHGTEPGCAVKAAVAEGALEPGRLASHTKLQRELAFLERKQDKRAQSEQKKKCRAATLARKPIRVP